MSYCPPARPSARYKSLDAWRGITCLAVIVYHATIFGAAAQPPAALISVGGLLLFVASKLFHGVMLFFVISGYCIAAAVDASVQQGTPITEYFWRRLRRIFPPFWVLFGFAAVISALGHAVDAGRFFREVSVAGPGVMVQPANLSGSQWLGNLTLTENWVPGILGRAPRYLEGTGHAWSLAYEEQFYAVCGLLLIMSGRRINRFFAGAAGVTLLTIAIAMSPAIHSRVRGLFLDGYWVMFACGIAVYYDRVYATGWQRRAVRGALGVVLMLGLLVMPKSGGLFVAAAFALALIGLQRWDATWARTQQPRFIWWCGTRCYSLYLVHWTLTRPLTRMLFELGVQSVWGTLLVTLPVCLGVSLLLGWAFHAMVERRFLNRPAVVTLRPVTPEPAAMLASVPVGAGHNVLQS